MYIIYSCKDWAESQESANLFKIRPLAGKKELRRTALSLLHVQTEQSLYGSEPPLRIVSKITWTFCGEQDIEKHFKLYNMIV